MGNQQKGVFIISLDFELNWGVHDVFSLEAYEENLAGTREAIDELLDLFNLYEIHATWATVGMLFFSSKNKLLQHLPEEKPTYRNKNFSPYEKLDNIGDNEIEDPYHYGASILKKIRTYPGQEIATHTFSHYYCLEEGQTARQFEADLQAAIRVGNEADDSIKTIIFPRNQVKDAYLSFCTAHGIQSYRGNPDSWIYKESSFYKESLLKKILRLADSYLNLTGHHTYSFKNRENEGMVNLPGSRFLRPYTSKLKYFERLKLQRIKKSIRHAASKGEIYHLWWHPHNFGKNTEENIQFLNEILQLVEELVKKEQMISLNMEEVCSLLNRQGDATEEILPQSQYEV